MLEKIFQKLLKKAYPNRNLEVKKIGKNFFIVSHDNLGSLTYSLQGTYTYEKVEYLNKLTTYSARFGFCMEKGPVAIIGIPNPSADWGYFEDVLAYGEIHSFKQFEFNKYSENTAKKIGNFTVYGLKGIEKISDFVKFDKISSVYDSRFEDVRMSHEYRVLKMKAKLEGKYTFKEVEELATNQQRWAVDRGKAYATLESGEHIVIMSFWYGKKAEAAGFRDVWEFGKPEPAVEKITFMTNEEAMNFDDFSVYLYDYNFFYKPKEAPRVIKLDRTFTPGFDFYDTIDGRDLRLSKHF